MVYYFQPKNTSVVMLKCILQLIICLLSWQTLKVVKKVLRECLTEAGWWLLRRPLFKTRHHTHSGSTISPLLYLSSVKLFEAVLSPQTKTRPIVFALRKKWHTLEQQGYGSIWIFVDKGILRALLTLNMRRMWNISPFSLHPISNFQYSIPS